MRVAMMLRAYDRPGGIGIYSKNIVRSLLAVDRENEYFLLYNNPDHVGTYNHLDNVEEFYLPPAHPVLWDQRHVPKRLKGLNIDLIFNTKFSVPLVGKQKKIMVLHGASWFEHPELYGRFDIFYEKLAMPIYCRESAFLISNSDLTTRDYKRLMGIPDHKIQTVNLAAGEHFVPVEDPAELERIRQRYNLPPRFILTVTSYEPRKNFGTLSDAWQRCREKYGLDIDLVVAGKNCHLYAADHKLAERGLAPHAHFPGWVEQADLPGIYSLATAFVFPSIYEEFGIPVVEAISCGCPVASSTTGAIPELLGEAALLCDPFDAIALSDNIARIAQDDQFRRDLVARGFEQSKTFSWAIAAQQTLDIMQRVMRR